MFLRNKNKIVNPVQLIKEPQIQTVSKSNQILEIPSITSSAITTQSDRLKRSTNKEQVILQQQKPKPKFYLNQDDSSSSNSSSDSSESDTYT